MVSPTKTPPGATGPTGPGFFAKGNEKDGKGPGDFSSWMATFLGSKVRENMLLSNMFQS